MKDYELQRPDRMTTRFWWYFLTGFEMAVPFFLEGFKQALKMMINPQFFFSVIFKGDKSLQTISSWICVKVEIFTDYHHHLEECFKDLDSKHRRVTNPSTKAKTAPHQPTTLLAS